MENTKKGKKAIIPRWSAIILIAAVLLGVWLFVSNRNPLPNGFAYVTDVIPTAQLEIRYFSEDNFVGAVIDGYEASKAILTVEAANALKKAADILYDRICHKNLRFTRPQRAVNYFMRWAKDLGIRKTRETLSHLTSRSVRTGI